MSLGVIWAQSTTGVIGRDGQLPWSLPEDLAHFRAITAGQPVIMGRRTWESLPVRFRPLPDRRNIVLSRQPAWRADGAEVCAGLDAALELVGSDPAWVIGGAEVYKAAIPYAAVAEVTEIDIEVAGDTYAPDISWAPREAWPWSVSRTGLRYRFLRYTLGA